MAASTGFVDGAVLISKLQHGAALHHDRPVDPATRRKQENMFVCSQSLSEAEMEMRFVCVYSVCGRALQKGLTQQALYKGPRQQDALNTQVVNRNTARVTQSQVLMM